MSGNDFGSSGTGRAIIHPFPRFENGMGMKKKQFSKIKNRKGMKKSIPTIRKLEGKEKKTFPQFGNRNQRLLFLGMARNSIGESD